MSPDHPEIKQLTGLALEEAVTQLVSFRLTRNPQPNPNPNPNPNPHRVSFRLTKAQLDRYDIILEKERALDSLADMQDGLEENGQEQEAGGEKHMQGIKTTFFSSEVPV